MPVSPCTALTSSMRRLSHHSATAGATSFPVSLPTHCTSTLPPAGADGSAREQAAISIRPTTSRPKAARHSRKDPLGGLPEAVGMALERVENDQTGEQPHVV